jgi:hypothetical protein
MADISGIRGEKIDYILSKASEYYGVPKEKLTSYNKGKKGGIWRWKRNIAFVLFNYTDLAIEEIKTVLGYQSYNTVNYHIKEMTDNISDKVYGEKRTKRGYDELVKFIGL